MNEKIEQTECNEPVKKTIGSFGENLIRIGDEVENDDVRFFVGYINDSNQLCFIDKNRPYSLKNEEFVMAACVRQGNLGVTASELRFVPECNDNSEIVTSTLQSESVAETSVFFSVDQSVAHLYDFITGASVDADLAVKSLNSLVHHRAVWEQEKASLKKQVETLEAQSLEDVDERDHKNEQIGQIAEYLCPGMEWSNLCDLGVESIEAAGQIVDRVAAFEAREKLLTDALNAVRSYMIPGMNWTCEIGEALKDQADAALSSSAVPTEAVPGRFVTNEQILGNALKDLEDEIHDAHITLDECGVHREGPPQYDGELLSLCERIEILHNDAKELRYQMEEVSAQKMQAVMLVVNEIIETAPREEPEWYEGSNNGDIRDNAFLISDYALAKRLKEALGAISGKITCAKCGGNDFVEDDRGTLCANCSLSALGAVSASPEPKIYRRPTTEWTEELRNSTPCNRARCLSDEIELLSITAEQYDAVKAILNSVSVSPWIPEPDEDEEDEAFDEWIRQLEEDVIQGEYGYEPGEFTVHAGMWRPHYDEGLTPTESFKRALDAFDAKRKSERM